VINRDLETALHHRLGTAYKVSVLQKGRAEYPRPQASLSPGSSSRYYTTQHTTCAILTATPTAESEPDRKTGLTQVYIVQVSAMVGSETPPMLRRPGTGGRIEDASTHTHVKHPSPVTSPKQQPSSPAACTSSTTSSNNNSTTPPSASTKLGASSKTSPKRLQHSDVSLSTNTSRTSATPAHAMSAMLKEGTTPTQRISRAKKGKRVHACNHPGCEKVCRTSEIPVPTHLEPELIHITGLHSRGTSEVGDIGSCTPAPRHGSNGLRRHQLNHSTEVYYKCDMCERTFVRQDLLTRHTERQYGPSS